MQSVFDRSTSPLQKKQKISGSKNLINKKRVRMFEDKPDGDSPRKKQKQKFFNQTL